MFEPQGENPPQRLRVALRRRRLSPSLEFGDDLRHVGDVPVVGQGDRPVGIEERLGVANSARAEGLVPGMGDPEVSVDHPKGFEDVVGQTFALFEGEGSPGGVPDEQSGVGGAAMLQKMGAVGQVPDDRPPLGTDDPDDSAHARLQAGHDSEFFQSGRTSVGTDGAGVSRVRFRTRSAVSVSVNGSCRRPRSGQGIGPGAGPREGRDAATTPASGPVQRRGRCRRFPLSFPAGRSGSFGW